MDLFQLITTLRPDITPQTCKVHLHVSVPEVDPLDAWRRGTFDEFQSWQGSNIYTRPYTVALIRNHRGGYLFAGVYAVLTRQVHAKDKVQYGLEAQPEFAKLAGRLHVRYPHGLTPQPCYRGENVEAHLEVGEITAEPLGIGSFPGFRNVHLSKADLDLLIRTQEPSWKAALSSVKGIYLITDTSSGALYVGKASGADGFWGRWASYSRYGHGGNAKMIRLLDELSHGHTENFSFAIPEVADLHTDPAEIDRREGHWKRVLRSRDGLNGN